MAGIRAAALVTLGLCGVRHTGPSIPVRTAGNIMQRAAAVALGQQMRQEYL